MMIPWYVYALMSAVFGGIGTIVLKKSLKRNHAMEVGTTLKIFQFLFVLLFLVPFIDFSIPLWLLLVVYIMSLIGTIAGIHSIKAYRHENISLISPLYNISPLFLVVFSAIILGERITLFQFIGILALLAGTYILEAQHGLKNIKEPIINMFKSKYTKYVFLAMILYSITSVGDKYVLGYVKPLTLAFYAYLFVTVNYIIVLSLFHNGFHDIKHTIKNDGGFLIFVALLGMLSVLAFYHAAALAMVSLVIPIKRFNTLIQTLLGGEIFHEKGLLHKSLACVVMIAGATFLII